MVIIRPLKCLLLLAVGATARRSFRHVGRQDVAPRFAANEDFQRHNLHGRVNTRADAAPKFLNSNTSSFAVNGTGIPDVNFDVGESYAGQLPISSDPNEVSNLFWWFFPSTNPKASKEILIWLNGGVSSKFCLPPCW